MAIIEIKKDSVLNQKTFICLAVDVPNLPLTVDGGSVCKELDGAQRVFMFDGTIWREQ